MRVLVTGGGGFLGLAIVEQLLKAGYEVVTYSRGKYPALEKLNLTHYQSSLLDYPSLKTALQNCEAVIHTAAKVGMWGSYQDFYDTNVRGTENILKACAELQIRYLVYTSSPSVVFNGHSEGKNEEQLPYPEKFDAYYPHTKAIAERAVLQANSEVLATCSLRPHLIWGPKDPHLAPGFFERQREGKLRIPGTGAHLIDTIYVENAARAHLLALQALCNQPDRLGGKAYFLSQNEPISIIEFVDRLLEAGGLPKVDKTISPRLALFAGWVLQNVYKWFQLQSEPPITLFMAKQLSSPHWFDISAAKRDLSYEPIVSIEEGMKRLRAWLKANGMFSSA